ncbi:MULTISPECIES: TonB-dependent receptor [unclassified Sphingobium]|uniref:TonB-dependent receptor n=1 Tax=unclassified Sphingobium TaxID=2611147 RepID=UPI0022243A21|nr:MULTISPECIES: TonB-dependent receptor [unclassified Sphingobium]MCW2411561.1 iron complex outermembrane receptor protein [Sphingobium sp. B8D3D]MCW2416146.1 iron complex outermembrane receptor protein [Sphingobium sp. B8D3A]
MKDADRTEKYNVKIAKERFPRGDKVMKVAFKSSLAVSLFAIVASGAAHAQTSSDPSAPPAEPSQSAQADPVRGDGDIIVTAQFRSQTVQKTPLAISALNAELLAQKGVTDIIGAANLAPNVQLSNNATGYGGTAAIYIRGVGQRDPNFAVEPGVGVYVDEVYYGVMPGAVTEMVDVERVEILRGPQGTLAGKNSIGGAIRLFSKQPGPNADAFIEVGAGSRNSVVAKGATNVTIADQTLYGRVAFGVRHSEGYMDRLDYACATGTSFATTKRTDTSCMLGQQGGRDVFVGRASLLWTPSADIENLFVADVSHDRSENPAVKTLTQSAAWAGTANYITGPESYTNYENYEVRPTSGVAAGSRYYMSDRTPVDSWGISNTLKIKLGDVSLTSITGYRRTTISIQSAADGTPASILDQIWNMKHRQFSQELRLNGSFGALLDWTAGGYYYDAKGLSTGRLTIPGGVALGGGGVNLDALYSDPVETRSKSVFLHTVLHPIVGVNITGAVRYTDDFKSFTFHRYNIDGSNSTSLGGLTGVNVTFKGERVDYRIAADVELAQDLLAYAQLSTGYKGGGVNPRPYFASQALPYEPETLTSYEVGFKSRFFDRRVTLNVSAFINDYKDFQGTLTRCDSISPFAAAPCSQTTNIGDARIKGIEGELTAEPIDGLKLDGSLGYLNFEYTRINPSSGVLPGMTNEYTPEWTGSAGIQYRLEAGKIGSFTPRVDMAYRSRVETRAVNDPRGSLPGRALVSAKLTWRDQADEWQAEASVTNLLDKFYYNAAYVLTGAPYFTGLGVVGEPRTFMFTVRRSFK